MITVEELVKKHSKKMKGKCLKKNHGNQERNSIYAWQVGLVEKNLVDFPLSTYMRNPAGTSNTGL